MGGLDMQQQARELARRPHVVIATPGRLRVSRKTWPRQHRLSLLRHELRHCRLGASHNIAGVVES